MPKISVSFKNTTKDMKLYTHIMSLEEKSGFIKEAIEYYINNLDKKDSSNNIE